VHRWLALPLQQDADRPALMRWWQAIKARPGALGVLDLIPT